MSKYDWSGVPSEIEYIAQDKDGHTWAFRSKPVIIGLSWRGECQYCYSPDGHLRDWHDSLEKRPCSTQ